MGGGEGLGAGREASAPSWVAKSLREAAGPALTANRVMGGLASVAASRVAREFRLGGPSFTVSAEENSGLKAVEAAARALQRGEVDAAVVGAADAAGDGRALAGAHALKPWSVSGRARPFDAAADGATPGEGAATVVLKRLEDALRDGDRVYAVIKGIGAASGGGCDDGVPTAAACAEALRRAYEDARVDPSRVGLLECHGSGDPREDLIRGSRPWRTSLEPPRPSCRWRCHRSKPSSATPAPRRGWPAWLRPPCRCIKKYCRRGPEITAQADRAALDEGARPLP